MSTRYRTSCDCGFQSALCRSQAQADFALRSHSCERWREKAASRARGEARTAAVDRTPKSCLHKRARHQHGTHACYVLDRCRCLDCSAATARYESHRVKQRAYGREAFVDAELTRQHVRSLMAAGIGLKRIVALSGVPQGVVWKLIYGKRRADGVQIPSKRIRWETAVRLQIVRADLNALAGGARIPSLGVQRRVQGLVALGWSQSKLGDRLGIAPGNFGHMMSAEYVTVRTARAVVALYNELWETRPPESTHRDKIAASRSRRYAAVREWAVPAAWADVNIDDPNAHPNATGYDNERVEAVLAGALVAGDIDLQLALTRVDRLEVLRRGRVVYGWPTAETARQTGISAKQYYNDAAAQRRATSSNQSKKLPPAEDIEFLLETGETIATIASRYGVTEDGVCTALRRTTAA